MSTGPSSEARASTAAESRTSSGRIRIPGLAAASFVRRSELISVARTSAPSRAKAAAVAAPIPWPAAVSRAFLPWRRPEVTIGVGVLSFSIWPMRSVRLRNGGTGEGRTRNLYLRRVALYPVELQPRRDAFASREIENRRARGGADWILSLIGAGSQSPAEVALKRGVASLWRCL